MVSGAIEQAIIPPGLLVAGTAADLYGVSFWWALLRKLITAMGAGAFSFPEIKHIEEQAARQSEPNLQ